MTCCMVQVTQEDYDFIFMRGQLWLSTLWSIWSLQAQRKEERKNNTKANVKALKRDHK